MKRTATLAVCASGWIVAAAAAFWIGGGVREPRDRERAESPVAAPEPAAAPSAPSSSDAADCGEEGEETALPIGADQYDEKWYLPHLNAKERARLALESLPGNLLPDRRVLAAMADGSRRFSWDELEPLAEDMAACTDPLARELVIQLLGRDFLRNADDERRLPELRILCAYATSGTLDQRQAAAETMGRGLQRLHDPDVKLAAMKEMLCDRRDGSVNVLGVGMFGEEYFADGKGDEQFLDLYEYATVGNAPEIAQDELAAIFYCETKEPAGDLEGMRRELEARRDLLAECRELFPDEGSHVRSNRNFVNECKYLRACAKFLDERGEDGEAWYAAERAKLVQDIRDDLRGESRWDALKHKE